MLDSILINVSLFEGVFVPFSICQVMRIVARVLEWADPTALVEMTAGDIGKSIAILVYQLLFELSLHYHASGWDHQVRF